MGKTKGAGKKRALPAALAKVDARALEAKTARLRKEARGLLDLVARRKHAISEAFYDIGEALARLRTREMLAVLGRRSFALRGSSISSPTAKDR